MDPTLKAHCGATPEKCKVVGTKHPNLYSSSDSPASSLTPSDLPANVTAVTKRYWISYALPVCRTTDDSQDGRGLSIKISKLKMKEPLNKDRKGTAMITVTAGTSYDKNV